MNAVVYYWRTSSLASTEVVSNTSTTHKESPLDKALFRALSDVDEMVAKLDAIAMTGLMPGE